MMEILMEDSGNGFEMGKYSEWFSIGLDDNMSPRGAQMPFLRVISPNHPKLQGSALKMSLERLGEIC